MKETYCVMTKVTYTKTGKVTYKPQAKEVKHLTEENYHDMTCKDALQWFRRLGGSETAQRTYTSKGYKIFKLISTSPDKETKVIREFNFEVN